MKRLWLCLALVCGCAAFPLAASTALNDLFDSALAQLRADQRDEALATARRAVQLAPTVADAWVIVGYVRQERKEYPLAVAAFQKAARLAPQRPMPWVDLAWTYNLMHEYEKMAQASRMALKLGPDLPMAWRDLATAQSSLGQLTEAIESYRQALRLDPRNGRYRAYLASVLADAGRYDEAFDEYEGGLEEMSNQMAIASTNLAWSAQNVGDMTRSAEAANEATRLAKRDGTRAEAYNALAYALMYAGDLPGAAQAVSRATALAPKDPYYQDTAAIVALLSNDLPAAEKHLAGVLAHADDEDYASPTLALYWARQGTREQARAQLDRIEEALRGGCPAFPEASVGRGDAGLAAGQSLNRN
jgi:Flp pilus assembly protein TadD